jgi:hypothetical protein
MNNNYVVKPEEISALHNLLNFQFKYTRSKIADMDFAVYLDDVFNLANISANVKNPLIQGWIDSFYVDLIEKSNLDKMYVAFRYWQYRVNKSNEIRDPLSSLIPNDLWPRFINPEPYENNKISFPVITAPKIWKDKNEKLKNDWMNSPPATIIGINSGIKDNTHQKVVLDQLWNTAKPSIQNNKALWNKQPGVLHEMKKYDSDAQLTAQNYLFFFHLLVGLLITNDITPQIRNLTFETAGSDEYPDDTFLNQLIFLVVLLLANPAGDYRFDNKQLIDFLKTIQGFIASSPKLDEAFKTGLKKNLNRLHVDDHYPYAEDNYENRMVDTVNALNNIKLSRPPQ